VIPLPLATVVDALGARLVLPVGMTVEAAHRQEIRSVSTDTRVRAMAPALFVALPTERSDGHEYLAAAGPAGAIAALVTRPSQALAIPQLVVADTWVALRTLARTVLDRAGSRVVGITGSYGKTTTKDLTPPRPRSTTNWASRSRCCPSSRGPRSSSPSSGRDSRGISR